MSKDLRSMTRQEIRALMETIGEKPFRGDQVFKWVSGGVESFDEMTNLSKELRKKLASAMAGTKAVEGGDQVGIGNMIMADRQISGDGTRKYLFELADGNAIETVFMKYKYGNSLCISSQAGCAMGCRFCASGLLGLSRNLTPGEMYGQVLEAEKDAGDRISHIVVMGTGEPLANYDNLAKFLNIVHDEKGLGLSFRNITISTCGLVPEMKRFAEDFPQVTLAISLHAPSDEIRDTIMPINRKYPMAQVLAAAAEHGERTGRRVTFEYALTHGVNDSLDQADILAGKLKGMLCHVNLIPLNEVAETGLETAGRERAEAFCARLERHGIPATVRRELGSDIDAACGQLRLKRSRTA